MDIAHVYDNNISCTLLYATVLQQSETNPLIDIIYPNLQ